MLSKGLVLQSNDESCDCPKDILMAVPECWNGIYSTVRTEMINGWKVGIAEKGVQEENKRCLPSENKGFA